ncbi:MAG: hypothetical protein ACNA8P_12150 [Phycisphaerales bacterium]
MSRNNPSTRDIFAQAVIVSALAFAASSMYIAPIVEDRDNTLATLQAINAEIYRSSDRDPRAGAAEAAIQTASRYRLAIDERSRYANDELALYETYRHLAEQTGITIDRFDPREIRATARPRGKDSAREVRPDFAAAVRIDATGDLPSVIDFIDRLGHEAGFVRIRSSRITPNGNQDNPTVRMTLEAEHFSFSLPGPAEDPTTPRPSGGS